MLAFYAFVLTGLLACCSQEGKLTSYLLNDTRYSSKFRPVDDDNHTVDIKHSLILLRIVKLVSKHEYVFNLKCLSDNVRSRNEREVSGFGKGSVE